MRRQRIFISSVMRDYGDRREAAEEVIRSLGMEPILAETLDASAGAPRDIILNDAIRGCQAMIGIYGPRYGWTGTQKGLSPTEEEYERARELYKPIYAFIDRMDNEAVEPRQQAFLDKVQNWDVGVLRREFHSLKELQDLVREALTGRDLSPRYLRFLERLTEEAGDINGLSFREKSEPFVPAFNLLLHAPANQFTQGNTYVLVIDGDSYDRTQVNQAIETWFTEVNRLLGAGSCKTQSSTSVLIAVEDNPYNYHKQNLQKNRTLFSSTNYCEMLVDLRTGKLEFPPGGKQWFYTLKKAVESAL